MLQLQSNSQHYEFELDSKNYTSIDTTKAEDWYKGNIVSVKFSIPFNFPFLSSQQKSIIIDDRGSLLLEYGRNIMTDARIELHHNQYIYKKNSYTAYQFVNENDIEYLEIEFANVRLESDTNVNLSFKGRLYDDGTIEVIIGPNNLDKANPNGVGFYCGIDTNNFTWSYFLTGNPENPTVSNDPDSFIKGLAPAGTVYRFKPVVKTSIASDVTAETINIFPNPAQNQLQIHSSTKNIRAYRIINSTGQEVQNKTIDGSNLIDISKLAKGTYFIELITDKSIIQQQFIKN